MAIISNIASQSLNDGISISVSNVLINKVPVISDAGVGEDAANISDPDHSLNYTSGTDVVDFSVGYGGLTGISYVAISGHNAASNSNATIQLLDGATVVDSVLLKRNNNVMFTFPQRSFVNLIIKFIVSPNTYQTTVSFIAAGKHFTIPTGEQAGYKRAWLNRSTTQKTTSNFDVAPVSTTQKSKSLMGSLSFPNQLASFTQDQWQDFIDFSFEQPFFIKEVREKPESSYTCFDPTHGIAAHSQTRALDAITLKFSAFNGL